MDRRRRRARWPWAVAALIAVGVAGWLGYRQGRWLPAAPEAVPPAPAPTGQTTSSSPPREAPEPGGPELPPLDDSDGRVQDEARVLSAHPAFDGWLRSGSLIRRFVAAVENVADGDSPRTHLSFLAPPQPFRGRTEQGQTVIDPASYARYDAVADVVASLDAAACVRVYRALRPLLEQAYGELGRPDRTFDDTLRQAIARLLATPVPDGGVELTALVTTYQLADPRLEALSPAEKHLLRLGPRNARLVQGKLREIEDALRAPS